MTLASAAYLEGLHYRPRIDKQLLQAHASGIICLSGDLDSELAELVLNDRGGEARQVAGWFQGVFTNRYFVEIQNHGSETEQKVRGGLVAIANELEIPLVATHDVHYAKPEDSDLLELVRALETGHSLAETTASAQLDGFHMRSPCEMYSAFPGFEDAVRHSQEIADSIDPDMTAVSNNDRRSSQVGESDANRQLRRRCLDGLTERYRQVPARWDGDELTAEVRNRLDRELVFLDDRNYAASLLVLSELASDGRGRGIPLTVFGKAAGSLVVYALGLSQFDPLEHALLVEPFIAGSQQQPDISSFRCQITGGMN